jgi:hypothetical protein
MNSLTKGQRKIISSKRGYATIALILENFLYHDVMFGKQLFCWLCTFKMRNHLKEKMKYGVDNRMKEKFQLKSISTYLITNLFQNKFTVNLDLDRLTYRPFDLPTV